MKYWYFWIPLLSFHKQHQRSMSSREKIALKLLLINDYNYQEVEHCEIDSRLTFWPKKEQVVLLITQS